MKLTKENVYVDLQGKTKEELTDLYNFLESVGEKPYRNKEYFLEYEYSAAVSQRLGLDNYNRWSNDIGENKTEVTIEQLKEILQSMGIEALQEKEQRLLEELEEVRKEIEENKIKVGDWVWNALNECYYKKTSRLHGVGERKITNSDLIKLLEQEIKY